ncbi:UNVERIFIED_CONTAM: hypothetical protein FKN15_065004 [Acipenser sinensis]
MGFDLDRFAEDVDSDLKCKLCTKVLEEPLSTPCGHVFCAGCLLPWAVQQRLCPLQCQSISAKELHQVLPLKNLIQKLDIRCDFHARGCAKTVKLQELRDHVEMCDYSPAQCRNKGCKEVLNLKDMDSHMRESCDYRPVGICQKGCGLVLLHKDLIQGNHCCLRALRAQNGALQVKTSSLEQDTKKQAVKLSKREKSLLAQVSALQNEVQLTALRYQKKFNQYMIHINNITKYVASHCKGGEQKTLNIVLHRESDSLGFNIIGGRPCQNQEDSTAEGIYISKILKNGSADRADGLQVHDRIVEVRGVWKTSICMTSATNVSKKIYIYIYIHCKKTSSLSCYRPFWRK